MSNKYNIAYSTIIRYTRELRDQGIIRCNRLTEDTIEGIKEDFNNGLYYKDIAKKYNVSTFAVYTYGDKRGRGNKSIPDNIIESIKNDYDSGMDMIDIAKKRNVSISSVYKYRNGKKG